MYSIGEFARLGAVSIRTLRHYDRLGLLRPAHIDPENGYRYRAEQLTTLNRIAAVKELGFGLKEVGQLLGELTTEELRCMLLEQRIGLERDLADQRARLAAVEARLRAIEKEDHRPDDVKIKSLPAVTVAAIARPAPGVGPDNLGPILTPAFEELSEAIKASAIEPTGPYFAFYTGRPDDRDLVAYAARPVADNVAAIQPPAEILLPDTVPEAATVVRRGTVTHIYDGLYAELARWLEQHGLEHVGAGRDAFLEDSDDPEAEVVVEIQWPIRRPGEAAPSVAPRRPPGQPVAVRQTTPLIPDVPMRGVESSRRLRPEH
jgi:DNA-binding transcriptional MerR regulator/effector-binding domain-containing protein